MHVPEPVPSSRGHSTSHSKPFVGRFGKVAQGFRPVNLMRFVILTHDWPFPHWDFLAEADGVLRAWRLLAEPVADTDIPAERNFNHRLFYLGYEGPVSGGRGTVSRWDAGTCEWLADVPDRSEIELRGTKLVGRAVLRREGEAWVFRVTAPAAAG